MFTENLDNKTREKKAAAAAEVKFALCGRMCAFKMMFKHLFNAMFSI